MGDTLVTTFRGQEQATLIAREARAREELVFSFKQHWTSPSDIPAAMQQQYSPKGYCFGLCAQWIGLRLNGGNFDFDRDYKTLSARNTMTGLYLQAVYSNRFNKELWKFDPGHPIDSAVNFLSADTDAVNRAAQNEALAFFGLKLSPHARKTCGGADGGFLLACAEMIPGTCLLDWSGPDGSHATAMNSRPREQEYDYFDPNCGHFAFRSKQRFRDWFFDYATRMGYRHTLDQRIQYTGISLL